MFQMLVKCFVVPLHDVVVNTDAIHAKLSKMTTNKAPGADGIYYMYSLGVMTGGFTANPRGTT